MEKGKYPLSFILNTLCRVLYTAFCNGYLLKGDGWVNVELNEGVFQVLICISALMIIITQEKLLPLQEIKTLNI
ncbi:hypothetical protein [Massilibacteroides vaginae]|uniref:hypothetical protein n=1 Tax=Massilibacteroides vaginae TaxID=1673718 RepID=UPI00111C50C1|nr:hypothetical protein [Massilibacteroides vaginae]